ncbi:MULTISPECIES: 4Fe-4S binding protein [unclassified Dehalobacter]|uniref:4Fe-4S binding protein n=1 Tax=unclassified Dehalobacter TaxID=2635733 RepID=UPI00028B5812|nr:MULTISPECIES: 4Fe-4S binding protein [unclassified Dehalobacter]AFV03398.1 putative transcriptional regulator (PceC like) [Dehalobacter sp. DCA]AFV06385.1 putative transcriptional regulator (PceC like) [Dehalobacter sp. CF]
MKNTANKMIVFAAAVVFLLTLGLSWTHTDNDMIPFMNQVFPEAQSFQKIASSPVIYEGRIQGKNGEEEKIGYVVIEQAVAYGGPIKMVTGIDLKGKIVGTVIAAHKDTPSFIDKVIEQKYLEKFIGKDITDPLSINKDIDRISGATFSTRGIAKAVSQGSHAVARSEFGLNVKDEVEPSKFGSKEIAVIALVILMVIGVAFKQKKLRWLVLLGSLVIIGFQYNTPISLANITGLLMGNFPSVRENLVWYILLIGIPVITFILGKNVYCFWLCPFGALQEITAKVGGGKFKCCNKRIEAKAAKIRYILIYLALIGAFLTKTPSFAGYEPFATLFGRQGFGIQWLILPVVIFSSFFISRFWCRFFCPGLILNEIILRPRKYIMGILEKGIFKKAKLKKVPGIEGIKGIGIEARSANELNNIEVKE